jgi:hypothetical protein
VRLAGLTVGRARERDASSSCTKMRQDAAVKDLIVRVRQHDEQRRAP